MPAPHRTVNFFAKRIPVVCLLVGLTAGAGGRNAIPAPPPASRADEAEVAPEESLPTVTEHSTLDDYLTYAARNNAGLRAAFLRWKAALEKVPQVKAYPDPGSPTSTTSNRWRLGWGRRGGASAWRRCFRGSAN